MMLSHSASCQYPASLNLLLLPQIADYVGPVNISAFDKVTSGVSGLVGSTMPLSA